MINIIDANRVNAPIIRSVIEFFAPISVSIPFRKKVVSYIDKIKPNKNIRL